MGPGPRSRVLCHFDSEECDFAEEPWCFDQLDSPIGLRSLEIRACLPSSRRFKRPFDPLKVGLWECWNPLTTRGAHFAMGKHPDGAGATFEYVVL